MTHSNRRDCLAGAAGLVAGGLMAQAGRAEAQTKAKPGERDLLAVVDVQNDFIPGGALAVKGGDTNAGKKPFETVALAYGTRVLWPDQSVQGTPGADFRKGLEIPHADLIIRKGYRRQMDSYSAFFEAGRKRMQSAALGTA